MMRTSVKVMTIAAVAALCSAGTAVAQGLDFLHDQRAEGGRWCMADHYHQGSSSGQATRAAAERAAIASYSSFTAWEYGNSWGSWRIAAGRKMGCSQSGGSWGCDIEARPCRPLVAAGVRRARAKQ
jgi:hypothetical protein